jgi:glycosyltransferase involved in cell wall biosynthesis
LCLEGIANQTQKGLTVAVVDDASPKFKQWELIQEFIEKYPDMFVGERRRDNGGTAAALNDAFRLLEDCDWVSKMDADDIISIHREKQRANLAARMHPRVAIIYDNFYELTHGRHNLPVVIPRAFFPYDRERLLQQSYICGPSMVRMEAFQQAGPWGYEGYYGRANRHSEDYEMWLRITDHWDAFWMDVDPMSTWTYRHLRKGKSAGDPVGTDFARFHVQKMARERRLELGIEGR